MTAILRHALALAGFAIATQAAAQITFYEHSSFRGQSFTTEHQVGNLERHGFNNRASSARVRGEPWEVCDTPGFSGRCVVLRPGDYPSLGAMGLNDSVTSVRRESDKTARIDPPVAPGPAQVTLYGRENFQGRSMTIDRPIGDLERFDFGDRASSVVVQGGSWEVCDDIRFGGRCVVLRPGRYPSLVAMGLDNSISSLRLAGVAPAPAPAPATGQVTLYGRENFQGRSMTIDRSIGDLERFDFADRASSVVVQGGSWEVCDDIRFGGRCVVLRPGRYPSLVAMGLDNSISSLRLAGVAPAPAPAPATGQVTLYGRENFEGRSIIVDQPVGDLERFGFADRASSVMVTGTPWEVCDDVRFSGRCVVLRPGRYPSLATIGMDNRISSVRAAGDARVDRDRYAPAPAAAREYRRRGDEQLYEANVHSVRAVVGTPEQRCWVEREQVVQDRSASVPGAVAGAVVGGIIGHQVASGRRQDLATAVGALAGAAVGSQAGRGQQVVTQDVQRCASVPRQAPEYYDVTYYFRGQEHRVQMTADPGATVTVNERGEPRE
jgi:uncharacterized protein YcfJ